MSQAVPVTAVNAKKNIPNIFKELHEELSRLMNVGANHANLSQLRLALRGLESEDATIRVAVMGINGQGRARRLVRAFLADPLVPRQEWEADVEKMKDDTRAVLIKYGEETELDDHHPLLRTICVPSPFLRNHRLELLVLENNAVAYSVIETDTSEQLLVPTLSTPVSASGRMSPIAYPVHKAVIYGEGLNDARDLFQLIPSSSEEGQALIYGVLNVQAQDLEHTSTNDVLLVNVSRGETAVAQLRQSSNKSLEYDHAWRESNLSTLYDALSSGTTLSGGPLKPILRAHIALIISTTLASLKNQTERVAALNSSPVTSQTRNSLQNAITSWAEAAHTELREDLAAALGSRSWRKLAWWKLLWRIDDISLLLTDIVQRSYLSSAEKHIIWVGGRIQEAGLLPPSSGPSAVERQQQRSFFAPPSNDEMLRMASASIAAASRQSRDAENSNIIDDPSSLSFDPLLPWPQQISLSRASLLGLLPSLQARAQALLLQSLSTSALASTVGALAYVSVYSTSVFEAGAVAALGIVWGARRLQVKWEEARKEWIQEVEQGGVKVLGEVERRVRLIVELGPKALEAEEGTEREGVEVAVEMSERAEAMRQVERVMQALERV